MGLIVEQPGGFLHDCVAVRSHEQRRAGFDRLGSLRIVAQHKHRLAERRRFLLHPTGIGQDEFGVIESRDEIDIVERRQKRDARMIAEPRLEDRADIGIGMNGHQDVHVAARSDFGKRVGDVFDASPEIFPTVACGEDRTSSPGHGGEGVLAAAPARFRCDFRPCRKQRVHNRVAGHHDAIVQDTFRAQCLCGPGRRGKVLMRDLSDDLAVGLLGER